MTLPPHGVVEFHALPPQCLQAFSSGLHYSSTTTHRSEGTGSLTELTLSTPISDESDSLYLEIFPSLFPYSQAITELTLRGDLCSDDRGVPVLQQLSHYCPRLRELTLPDSSTHHTCHKYLNSLSIHWTHSTSLYPS